MPPHDQSLMQSNIKALEFRGSPNRPQAISQGSQAQNNQDMDARDYNELMDEYSLHQLIIRKGKCLEEAPEFVSFKRTYLQRWASISFILMLLEKLLSQSDVEMAYIDGQKVADLSREDLELEKPSNEELFS